MALTLAPATPSPLAFLTTPAIEPVGTCALDGAASASAAITDKTKRKAIFINGISCVDNRKLSLGDDVQVKEKTGCRTRCRQPVSAIWATNLSGCRGRV